MILMAQQVVWSQRLRFTRTTKIPFQNNVPNHIQVSSSVITFSHPIDEYSLEAEGKIVPVKSHNSRMTI